MSIERIRVDDELLDEADLFNVQIKGRVDPIWRLGKQLDRCNILMSSDEVGSFDSAVRAALSDLPMDIKNAVLDRTNEFNSVVYEPIVEYWCGIAQREHDAKGNLLPLKTRQETITDYEKLFDIIKEELEKGGGSWQYEKKISRALKVQETLPRELVRVIVKNRVDLLQYLREIYPKMKLGYRDLNVGWYETPPTPIFREEEVEE